MTRTIHEALAAEMARHKDPYDERTPTYALVRRDHAATLHNLLSALEAQHAAMDSTRTGPDRWTDREQFEYNVHRVVVANAEVVLWYRHVCKLPREAAVVAPLGISAIVPPADGPWQRVCRWLGRVVGRDTRTWA